MMKPLIALATALALVVGCIGFVTAHDPTSDIAVRDALIQEQEKLLNVYRCMFGVDIEVVPGACVDGKPSGRPTGTAPTPTSTPNPAPIDPVELGCESDSFNGWRNCSLPGSQWTRYEHYDALRQVITHYQIRHSGWAAGHHGLLGAHIRAHLWVEEYPSHRMGCDVGGRFYVQLKLNESGGGDNRPNPGDTVKVDYRLGDDTTIHTEMWTVRSGSHFQFRYLIPPDPLAFVERLGSSSTLTAQYTLTASNIVSNAVVYDISGAGDDIQWIRSACGV